MNRIVLALVIGWVVLALAYAWAVPPGEAPDEAAHLWYVDQLAAGRLPTLPKTADALTYEAHQPPLDYAVSAVLVWVGNGGPIRYPFIENPDLRFDVPGSRAFVPAVAPSEVRAVKVLRSLRLGWGAAAVAAILMIGAMKGVHGIAAAAVFAFSPQFLFVSATVNNDASVTALAAIAMLLFLRGRAVGGAAVAGAAVWAKASGLALGAPLLLTRDKKAIAIFAAFVGGWLALNYARFGALMAPPPTGYHGGGLTKLADVGWVGSLFVTFWGKFGWLNLGFPWIVYALFVIPLLLLRWHKAGAALIAANVVLLLAYMIRIDWQPQGRYLFPSLGALAAMAAPKKWAWALLGAMIAADIGGVLLITSRY